jgi:glycerophosphoryl diester phosphodiesterase
VTRLTLALLFFVLSWSAAARPLVIAHRGASGLRPEHTLASYQLAIDQGADFIEADVVMTRDRVLVARHENEIGGTTDVASHPEFMARRATRTVDGQRLTSWFVEDFTLAELRTLRARERLPELRRENTRYDGQFTVPTLEEVIGLIHDQEHAKSRRIGLYVETKHPTYFRSIGLPLEEVLVTELARHGYRGRRDPIFIESFEVENLRRLKRLTSVRLVQLLDAEGGPADGAAASYAEMVTPRGLRAIARYAAAIGPAKAMIVPRDSADRSMMPTSLVADAHKAGLLVHPWTFRSENTFLPVELRDGKDGAAHGKAAVEVRMFRDLGVDGVFSDYPGEAVISLTSPNDR